MAYESVTIYRHKKTNHYLVQPMARHPTGASADAGDPTEITEGEFDSRIVPVVLDNLRKYHRQNFDGQLEKSFSDAEYSMFVSEHDCISVLLDDTGALEIAPQTPVRDGYVGIKGARIIFDKSEIKEKLANSIRQAFEAIA